MGWEPIDELPGGTLGGCPVGTVGRRASRSTLLSTRGPIVRGGSDVALVGSIPQHPCERLTERANVLTSWLAVHGLPRVLFSQQDGWTSEVGKWPRACHLVVPNSHVHMYILRIHLAVGAMGLLAKVALQPTCLVDKVGRGGRGQW